MTSVASSGPEHSEPDYSYLSWFAMLFSAGMGIGLMFFGVATSLGFGVIQINSGLNYLFDVPTSIGVQVMLIAGITAIATLSVGLGLDSGIRRISELNMILAVALMAFVLIAGPTVFLLQPLVQNTGMYLSNLFEMTFNLYAYEPTDWIGGWTLLYWGWWIAWAPFVGMFIARVSRGRTIREFVAGVLPVPPGFTFKWMTFFGNTAIHRPKPRCCVSSATA